MTTGPTNEQPQADEAEIDNTAKELEYLVLPPERQHLPDTRSSLVHKFSVSGFEGYLIVGYFEDGRPGEVFIKMAKEGSTLGGFCDAVGVLLSISLQHGVPLQVITNKLKNTRFEPSGLTRNPHIPETTSLCDYIARWLELFFLADDEAPQHRVSVKPPAEPRDATST